MRVDRLYASNGGVTQTIFAPLILLLSFCYSHFVTLKSFISGYISLKVPTILRIFGNNIGL